MGTPERLQYFVNGEWRNAESNEGFPIHNPSTGALLAHAPQCSEREVNSAVEAALAAFPAWSDTPPLKRVQVLFRFRELILEHLEELVMILCRENGKTWDESMGDVLKAKEIVEHACSIPSLMMGESLMETSSGYDTVLYREPVGVFVGIAPFNFPAMIPMGWMMPLCVACGNTMVLKASPVTPMTSLRMTELLHEAGLPEGVFNILTCSNEMAETLISHPDVSGVTFVGSSRVGSHVYAVAAAHGKRVQALTQAKNHALVMADAPLEQCAASIVNSAFGCAGERCMALPVAVIQEKVADRLVALIIEKSKSMKTGPAWERTSDMGPVISAGHKASVTAWIEKGIREGASLVLDGRGMVVKGYEEGYYLGPTIFDHVQPGIGIGDEEIFGPVLSIKRVKDFEHGMQVMNANPYANGSVIYTRNGHYSREFARRSHAGMVGINVGIPVPVSVFPFTGHKKSFYGDLHALGKDGVRFYTETKAVTSRWFDEEEPAGEPLDTWEGTMDMKQ